MTVYTGARTLDGVLVETRGSPLDPGFHVRTYSSLGFEWGYEGAAASQLALAMLLDHLQDPNKALALQDRFMRRVVANFSNEWEITGEDIDHVLGLLSRDGHNMPDQQGL